MINKILPYGFIFLLACLASCAIQVPPSGGEKDTRPPHILSMEPENNSVNFTGHDIRITFDEYIQLKDLSSQLLVSPPLNLTPVVKIRKHDLLVHFEDTLLSNTTYTFNFGNAIADNNEGNVLENFQYVFSTGSVIDSLSMNGRVENAFTGKPEKGVLVMLYRGDDDSLPYKQRPLYFSKTNESGSFRVRYIAPGTYRLFALREELTNYLYDNPGELIGFADNRLSPDTTPVTIRLFAEQAPLKVNRVYSEEPGKAVLIFTGRADTIPYRLLTLPDSLGLKAAIYSEGGDTLTFWYTNLNSDSLQLVLEDPSFTDTVTTRLFRNDPGKSSGRKFQLRVGPVFPPDKFQPLNRPLIFSCNHPVEKPDTAAFVITEDSVPVKFTSLHRLDSLGTLWEMACPWKESASYSLFIPPGACKDIFGLENDSTTVDFRTHKERDYGSISISIEAHTDTGQYIVQLVDDKEAIYRSSVFTSDTTLTYDFLLPFVYHIKLIHDTNSNDQWDTGNYLLKKQPEPVIYYPDAIQVRSNWDVELKWKPWAANVR